MDELLRKLKKFLAEDADEEAVKAVLESANPLAGITKENALEVAERDPVLKEALNAEANRRADKAVATYKEKNFERDYQERYNKENPPESETDKKLRDLEAKYQERERAESAATQRATMLELIAGTQIPKGIALRYVGDSEEATRANFEALQKDLAPYDENVKNTILKDNSRKMKNGKPEDGLFSRDQLKNLTPDEYESNIEKVNASLEAIGKE